MGRSRPKTWVFEEWDQIIFKYSYDQELQLMQGLLDKCYVEGKWRDDVTIDDAHMVLRNVSVITAHHLRRFSEACNILRLVELHPDFANTDTSDLCHMRSRLGIWLWLSGKYEQALEAWEYLFELDVPEWKHGRLQLWSAVSIIVHDESSPTDALSEDLRNVAMRVFERWPGHKSCLRKIREATTNEEFAIALKDIYPKQNA